ncbi:MAG: hypothetical protein A3G59_02160 [Candidatus Taylorbacteria bacterium RIFCSPLOWO2_12_FULL_47_20]|uniref:PPM-type phosphatase domain-containing protein n=2 Tax=Candidatus Tayloriibacteriota TaxID=1817919 RepID=A0A1G2PAE2_9BACT|nr:MAG: hypothetical protein A3H68_02960 [Candidatus Taylorbacteria bacterium RIFCSPLOWO2_02_FULL_46_40]OHA45253.1 MAG: hypothetical protein A3G59_02160 [Candidatus Taylorbacteria bacterium RIFCSPLOWO2_12_FULL_47_20]
MKVEHTVIQMQGGRDYMEDTYSVNDGANQYFFGGVYDGHMGSFAANFAALKVPEVYLKLIASGGNPTDSFVTAYRVVSDNIVERYRDVGACAVNFYASNRRLFTANAGDCELLHFHNGWATKLTQKHRVSEPSENKRLQRHRAMIVGNRIVTDVGASLVSRSLGDAEFRAAGVIDTPYVSGVPLNAGDMVLAATDGLFDRFSEEEIVAVVIGGGSCDAAARVFRVALADMVGSREPENVTVLLAKFLEL